MIGMAWMWKWNPQNAKDEGLAQAPSSRLHIFYFSDPRSHWVHTKANTIKRGWGFDHGSIAQVLIYIDPKILKHFSTSYLSKTLKSHLGPTKISYPGLIDHTHCLSQNLAFQFHWYGSRSHRDGVAKFLWWSCFISELPKWNDRNYRNEVLP